MILIRLLCSGLFPISESTQARRQASKQMKRIWRWSVLPGAEGGRDGIGPRSGELRTEKLKSHLLRTQSLKVLPLNPGVGKNIAIHAKLTTQRFIP